MKERSVVEQVYELIELASMIGPEGEGLDLTDVDYELEDLVVLKNRLSSMYKAIQVVQRALADYWIMTYGADEFDDHGTRYYVGKTKGRKAIDKDKFYAWLATKDADELAKLVPDYNIKVSGMTKTERTTLMDESPSTNRLSIRADST